VTDDDILLDWGVAKEVARLLQSARGDRQDRTDVARQRRRSPRGPTPVPKSAKMIAFPLGRRHHFVERLAAQIASRSTDAGEAHLLQQLARQREILSRKGVPEKAIERELRSLAAAIRAELWRLLLGSRA
jgi:hypothetical protein